MSKSREIRERIDAAWQELHTDGVDWKPAVMRLLTAHAEYIEEARTRPADDERLVRDLVRKQRDQLKFVTRLPDGLAS